MKRTVAACNLRMKLLVIKLLTIVCLAFRFCSEHLHALICRELNQMLLLNCYDAILEHYNYYYMHA